MNRTSPPSASRGGAGVAVAPRFLRRTVLVLSLLLTVGASPPPSVSPANPTPPLLARIQVEGNLAAIGLPIHAHFVATDGTEYVVVVATAAELRALGARATILGAAEDLSSYVLARDPAREQRQHAPSLLTPIDAAGGTLIGRATPLQAEELVAQGIELQRLSARPLDLRPAAPPLAAISSAWSSSIGALISQVSEVEVTGLVAELSGEVEVQIGGLPYTVLTRHTTSGEPLDKALQYVAERLAAHGLAVSFHDWGSGASSGRNVVGTLPGSSRPGEIVLMTAHLDDRPTGARAPGADDNATGCAALLAAAEALSGASLERTVKLAFFTGEEQGLLGSAAYASSLSNQGANVVAVLNLDMLGWNGDGVPTARLHTRTINHPSYPADRIIAATFTSIVNTYGLGGQLAPVTVADAMTASDHASFWNNGFAAILAVEDDKRDFNPHYHSVNDLLAFLDTGYLTAFVRAAVGTTAMLAGLQDGGSVSQILAITLTGDGGGKVVSDPAGINCGATCAATFTQGTNVTLSAIPDPESAFAEWTGEGCGSLPTCVVTMSRARHVMATFEPEGKGGPDTPGVFQPGIAQFALRNSNDTGWADLVATFGWPTDLPISGDWDGDGIDTIGVFRDGVFYVRNSNDTGWADISGAFGSPGDTPVAGDFNGDGLDEVGVFRDGLFTLWLREGGIATLAFGIPGDLPLAGDWTGKGYDSVGVFRPSDGAFYLRNSNTTGFANIVALFGPPGCHPVTGDWNGDGADTVGCTQGGVFYLRNANTAGPADIAPFPFGSPGDLPLSGDWDGSR